MIVVTGGAGFLGRHLVAELRRRGERVLSLDIRPRLGDTYADVRGPEMFGWLRGGSTVYHLAGEIPSYGWSKQPVSERLIYDTIARGTVNTLQAAWNNGVKTFVNVSSSQVYGRPLARPFIETDQFKPIDAYGRAKAEAENWCDIFGSGHMKVSSLRPMTILGDGFIGVLRIVMEQLASNKPIPLLGGGNNVLQGEHVSDLVNALILAANGPAGRYNIANYASRSIRAELEDLITYSGSKSQLVGVPRLAAKLLWLMRAAGHEASLLAADDFMLDTSLAQDKLGWKQRLTMQAGLADSWDWYRMNRWFAAPPKSLALRLWNTLT